MKSIFVQIGGDTVLDLAESADSDYNNMESLFAEVGFPPRAPCPI